MLALNLKHGDSFTIGEDILVVVERNGAQIRVLVRAPKDKNIKRYHAARNSVQDESPKEVKRNPRPVRR